MAKKISSSSAVVLSHFSFNADLKDTVDYFVEADQDGNWVQVGGPFNNKRVADGFARNYAIEHHTSTRVIIFK